LRLEYWIFMDITTHVGMTLLVCCSWDTT
jgi:hypothetical protein